MASFQERIKETLTGLRFKIVPNPKFDPNGTIKKIWGITCVWGKVVKPGITLRVVVTQSNGIVLCFVQKDGESVKEVQAARRTKLADLVRHVNGWEEQYSRKNMPCNKCYKGRYEFTTVLGRERVSVKCNRCNGKGWQDYEDQVRNEKYDAVMKRRQKEFGEKYENLPLKPHWRPYDD